MDDFVCENIKNYILECGNLNGNADVLVENIIYFVAQQGMSNEDSIYMLKNLLDRISGIDFEVIKLLME